MSSKNNPFGGLPPKNDNESVSFDSLLEDIEKAELDLPVSDDCSEQDFELPDFDFDDDLSDDEPEDKPETEETASDKGSWSDDDLEDDLPDPEPFRHKPIDMPEEKADDTVEITVSEAFPEVKEAAAEPEKKSDNRMLQLLVSIIGLLLLIIVVLIILMQSDCGCGGRAGKLDVDDTGFFDDNAIEGYLPGKTPEEIEDMLNQTIEEGMFNVSIAPAILFNSADGQGQARIENVPANLYHMSVEITLDDTGDLLYQSKGIKPGQFIEYITLEKQLAPGVYNATALFKAYDPETLKQEGQVAVKINIIVEK